MNVEVLESTEKPEQLACTCARNDYEERWVGREEFSTVMDAISPADPSDVPSEVMNWYADKAYTPTLVRRMYTLLTHLMQHGHFGPFEHPHITFAVEGVSRSLMAQLTRHRHASFDIQSMRYVSFDDVTPEPGEAVVSIPELDVIEPAGRNVEFSDGYEDWDDDELLKARQQQYENAIGVAFQAYNGLLNMGVAPENARMVLPIGTKVNMTFTLNARMLMHIADMRGEADAQWEIREMTEAVIDAAKDWMPITFGFYEREMRHRKNRLAP